MNKLYLALLCLSAASAVHAQDPVWSGSVRCDVTITGTGYTDRQIHTWQTTGGAPTKRGAFNIYAGTWSVSGGGSVDRTTGDQALHAQWTRNVQAMSGPLSVVTRASDGAVLIQADHAQLRGRGAVSGTQEVRSGGRVISSTPIAAEAFEHAFPSIKGTNTSTQLTGQTSDAPTGSFGYMQPGGSSVRVNCAWDFRRSDYTGGAPPNPAALPPVATPPTSTPPTTPSCETRLAESQATYDQLVAASERQYNQLLADIASSRTELTDELNSLQWSVREREITLTPQVTANIQALRASIAKLETDRVATEREKADAIATIRRNAAAAAAAIRASCGSG